MAPTGAEPPLVFLVAGEASGDLAGARLMASLARRTGGHVGFAGVGGPEMAAQGLDSMFPMQDLSLMGFAEILPHLPRAIRRVRQVLRALRTFQPALVLFIDCSGFARAVARRYRGPARVVQYKAPQAWAYWPWRARTMARHFDLVLPILPFEPAFFARYGVACHFIGHPAIDSGAGRGDGAAFRARHGIAPGAKLLALLPGSRRSEIRWSLPLLAETAALLAAADPELRIVVPTIGTVAGAVQAAAAAWPGAPIVVEGAAERYDAFAAADAALAASGTVTVELALAGVPMAAFYRASPVTAFVLRRIVTIRYATVVNLILEQPLIPELLQEECRPDTLAAAALRLLGDGGHAAGLRAGYAAATARLRPPEGSPTEEAAAAILALLAA